ncbi:tetratricopeptide repeat protein [Microbulbifer taiwanensis]|uniref:tetratricopeptide repeat protein n=1 Tax=Microbulbifer taiwanensis TaxID=986746 RepID=UPI00366C4F6A
MAHDLFSDTQDRSYLDYSKSVLGHLGEYYPNPLVVLQREITLSMDQGEMQHAENLLQDYERLSPGDPSILVDRARLEEMKGDLDAANRLLREAAATTPLSWSTRYKATSLAIRVGDVKTARNHIADALKLTPGNTLVLGQSGLVELLYGDLDLAISTYGKLLSRKRHRSYLVNLGLAMMLKERYDEAREKFVSALELQPGHRVAMLNLADVEMALGNREAALALYGEILNAQRASGSADAYGRMVEAQCLAHLGMKGEAVRMTLMALLRSEGDPEVAYQASLVYALAGDNESALVNAQAAIEGGMDKRWFSLPAFSSTSLPAMLGKE